MADLVFVVNVYRWTFTVHLLLYRIAWDSIHLHMLHRLLHVPIWPVSDLTSEPTQNQHSEHWNTTSPYQIGERKSYDYSHKCRVMQRLILGDRTHKDFRRGVRVLILWRAAGRCC